MTYIPGTTKESPKIEVYQETKPLNVIKPSENPKNIKVDENIVVLKGIIRWSAISTLIGGVISGVLALINTRFLFLIPLSTIVGIIIKIITNNFSNTLKDSDNFIKRYKF